MIKLLRISNIALISGLELEFGPGLNLLTGETGAGKSILIDALGLLLGARASSDLIRSGESQAVVEGVLEAPGFAAYASVHGLPAEDDELVIRREIQISGKTKSTVNGALVPVSLLKDLAPTLVAIHGQHETQGLLDPLTHIDILDRHAGLQALVESLLEPFRGLRETEAALRALREGVREAQRHREMLEYQVGEIEKAGLAPEEEETLLQEKIVQANSTRLAQLCDEAYAGLYDDEEAVVSRLGQIYRKVDELVGIDRRFQPHVDARAEVTARLEDLALFLRDYRESLEVRPGRLDEIEGRLALIERLKRKYGASVAEVLSFAARCRDELLQAGSPEERERALEAERSSFAARYRAVAGELSRSRRAAAKDLEGKVEEELALLAMEKARFRVRFDPETPPETSDGADWTEKGLEGAEFLLSANPGEELRPLARIASGGELSRIQLAFNSAASVDEPGRTLVFDEVDSGIGGRVAEVVGQKLRGLASRHQILCITHLPQIASLAQSHYLVSKRVSAGRTFAEVTALSGDERVEEVARMLGGATVSDTVRRHAREMVKQNVRS